MPGSRQKFALVLVTAPDIRTARKLARVALRKRLAACANLLKPVESHYWWRGKLESATEVLILFKTSTSSLRRLERAILAEHPYDTPEFIALALQGGNRRYLQWLEGCLS